MESRRLLGITVRKALQMDSLKDLIVLGGENGLDRPILSVNVMEVPDIIPWVKEGQLLLTTAFSIKDDPVAQESLIPALTEKGLAGLVIKTKRYLEEVPQVMIDAADVNDFPLLEMPQHLSHPIILETVYSALVNRQAAILRRSIAAHQKLMKVALEGGGIPAICESLFEITDNVVFIVGTDSKILGEAPLSQVAYVRDDLIEVMKTGQGYYSSSMSKEILTLDGKKFNIIKYPIHISGKWHGTIIIIEINRVLHETDFIAMEQAATVAALTLINQFALTEVEKKYKNEFIFDWVSGKITSEIELVSRGELVGLELRYHFMLIVFEIDDYQKLWQQDTKSKSSISYLKNRLYECIEQVASGCCTYFIIGERGGRFVLLLRAEHDSGNRENHKLAMDVAGRVRKMFGRITKHTCSAGIGRFREPVTQIPKSYLEAKKALEVIRQFDSKNGILCYDDLGVLRLLNSSNLKEANKIVNEIYMPLIQHDQATNSELTNTIRVYFQCNGNVSKVAKTIFSHYNTIVYRLNKIQEITGLSLGDSNDRFNLQLAIILGDLLSEAKTL
ncbi:MAG: PucR family transcriptional regulator [Bacillota bacterium]|jgi:purine catabolism regulator